MGRWDELDHDSAVIDALDGLITGVYAQLFANGFLDRDLTALSNSTGQFIPSLIILTSSS